MAEQHKGASKKTPTPNTAIHEPGSRNPAHPWREFPQGQHPSTDGRDDDLVYNLVKRNVPDYPSLERGPPPYQQVERCPASPQAMSVPVSRGPSTSCPSTSHTSSSAAASLPKDSRAKQLAYNNTRPQFSSPLQQPVLPNPQSADGADEIVELQGKAQAATAATEDTQDQAGGVSEWETGPVSHIPNTNFAIACMVALCFNLPLGILAIYFSLKAAKAFHDGQTKLGQKRSRWSIFVSLLGIAITTVLVSSIILYIAMQGQRRISQYKAYSVKAGLSL